MSDAEARAVGAGVSAERNGKSYQLSPLGMAELTELQREAVKSYKRQYLATFAENADMLPRRERDKIMADKFEQAARWEIRDLPARTAYDASRVPVTDELRSWVRSRHDTEGELPDAWVRAATAQALDAGDISAADVERMTGRRPREAKIPYDMWWITATYEGMTSLVWRVLRKKHPEIEREEVAAWPPVELSVMAREAEAIIPPSMGNT